MPQEQASPPSTVVITGASRGIGRAAALLAAEAGWRVAVNYRSDKAAADAVVDEILAAGGHAAAICGDVCCESDVQALFSQAAAKLGAIGAVVINAGGVAQPSSLADMSYERLRRMFELIVMGSYLCAREAARTLSRARGGAGGSIVLVSSIASRLGSPHEYVDYAGSKAALDALTLGLSKELGPEGVRVNAVRPGVIDTDIHASGGQPDRAARVGATAPLGRPGQPCEVAEAILWLMGSRSSYVTGALLDVAGGR